jgi:hypothetical protein
MYHLELLRLPQISHSLFSGKHSDPTRKKKFYQVYVRFIYLTSCFRNPDCEFTFEGLPAYKEDKSKA